MRPFRANSPKSPAARLGGAGSPERELQRLKEIAALKTERNLTNPSEFARMNEIVSSFNATKPSGPKIAFTKAEQFGPPLSWSSFNSPDQKKRKLERDQKGTVEIKKLKEYEEDARKPLREQVKARRAAAKAYQLARPFVFPKHREHEVTVMKLPEVDSTQIELEREEQEEHAAMKAKVKKLMFGSGGGGGGRGGGASTTPSPQREQVSQSSQRITEEKRRQRLEEISRRSPDRSRTPGVSIGRAARKTVFLTALNQFPEMYDENAITSETGSPEKKKKQKPFQTNEGDDPAIQISGVNGLIQQQKRRKQICEKFKRHQNHLAEVERKKQEHEEEEKNRLRNGGSTSYCNVSEPLGRVSFRKSDTEHAKLERLAGRLLTAESLKYTIKRSEADEKKNSWFRDFSSGLSPDAQKELEAQIQAIKEKEQQQQQQQATFDEHGDPRLSGENFNNQRKGENEEDEISTTFTVSTSPTERRTRRETLLKISESHTSSSGISADTVAIDDEYSSQQEQRKREKIRERKKQHAMLNNENNNNNDNNKNNKSSYSSAKKKQPHQQQQQQQGKTGGYRRGGDPDLEAEERSKYVVDGFDGELMQGLDFLGSGVIQKEEDPNETKNWTSPDVLHRMAARQLKQNLHLKKDDVQYQQASYSVVDSNKRGLHFLGLAGERYPDTLSSCLASDPAQERAHKQAEKDHHRQQLKQQQQQKANNSKRNAVAFALQ